jgi:hypothetical protein
MVADRRCGLEVLRRRTRPGVLRAILAGSLLVVAVRSALFLAGGHILPTAQTSPLVQTVTDRQVMAPRIIWSR